MITDLLPLVLGEGAGPSSGKFSTHTCTSSIVIWAYLDIACEGLDRLT